MEKLLHLPLELWLDIYDFLELPDRICLSLTCKTLATIGQLVDPRMGGHDWIRFDEWRKSPYHLTTALPLCSPAYPMRLRLLRQLEDFMPKTHRLCHNCCIYLPVDFDFWHRQYIDGMSLPGQCTVFLCDRPPIQAARVRRTICEKLRLQTGSSQVIPRFVGSQPCQCRFCNENDPQSPVFRDIGLCPVCEPTNTHFFRRPRLGKEKLSTRPSIVWGRRYLEV